MTRKEKRVVDAFISCVKTGEFTLAYATILIEDQSKYGWLSETAKDYFYDAVDPEPVEEEHVEEASEEPTEE